MGLFNDRTKRQQKTQVPVWFMRQAGRYHAHYQNIKKTSDFMSMCKSPQLACEITMGPIEDFHFDAAILFSDLLFPLELLGMGLTYQNGPPELAFHLRDRQNIKKLKLISPAKSFFQFQGDALTLLKKTLPSTKTLLGFVGAPFTLYTYAVEGSHAGSLVSAKTGLYDGTWGQFLDLLMPSLLEEMLVQARGGADAVCLFDTAAGELSLKDYQQFAIPQIKWLTQNFKKEFPDKKIIYYSKHTHLSHLLALEEKSIDVLGIDWRFNIKSAFEHLSKDYYIQGHIDPCWLHLPWPLLKKNLEDYRETLSHGKINLDRYIAGLGHGVLIQTPEENVKNTVDFIHQNFLY
jgi:uroporphyrinogen decarboxylase